MKSSAQIQHFKKFVILFMVGIVCSALAYAIHVINPTRAIINYKMAMTPTSFAFSLWKKPPIDIFIDVYIFNITNPDEFLAGKEKLKLEELGPYIFKEVMENTDVTWNDNGTLSYRPKREVSFVPERSVGDPWRDVVRVPNIPLLGIASALHDSSPLVTFPLTHAINLADSQSILNVTVHEYLWGYDDTLVNIASILVPKFIDFKKFGLLDRMYDEGDNIMTMNIRKNENMTDEAGRYLSIDMMNGSPGLSAWGYEPPEHNETKPENTICNRIQGSTEGVLFPMDLDRHAVFRVFRKAFCRPISISYKGEAQSSSGLWGYLYDFADGVLDMTRNTTENECYCRKMKKCLKKGLSDLTPCYYNIPAAMSQPHFLNSDPSLVEAVEGLKPDAEKHGNKIIIQPNVGIPLQVNSRIQTNLVMNTVDFSDRISPFNDLVIPIFWTDLNIPTLSDDILFLLKMGFQIGPILQTVLISLLAIGGAMAISWALLGTVWLVQQQDTEENKSDESNDLKIPLGYGQYTAIRILPAIKKITSKTDLFS